MVKLGGHEFLVAGFDGSVDFRPAGTAAQ